MARAITIVLALTVLLLPGGADASTGGCNATSAVESGGALLAVLLILLQLRRKSEKRWSAPV